MISLPTNRLWPLIRRRSNSPTPTPARWIVLCCLILIADAFGQPSSAPANGDAQLWQQLVAIDARGMTIKDLTADFMQQKFTTLLKKPMISKGVVRATSTSMHWDTAEPQPTQMHITESQASLYYPKEKLEEIYPVTGQLGSLAASPLPRLSILQKHFTFAADSEQWIDPAINDKIKTLSIRLTPIEAALREHVEHVRVLLDAERGFMIRCEITDADGDRTNILFSNVRINTGLDDAKLVIQLPADVKIVRPMEKLSPIGSSQPPATPRSQK